MAAARTVLVLLVVATLAGCVSTPSGPASPTPSPAGSAPPTPTSAPTVTSLPGGTPTLPDGPKERPERPATLNRSSVREYVRAFEYRYAYNSLWVNEYTEVTLECTVRSVNRTGYGYEAVVTCTGYSNTNVPTESTLTPGPHADWFTQVYRYRVDEDTTQRERMAMEG
jgi:hypothetical protein